MFDDSLDRTCLIQWVDFPLTMDKNSLLSNRDTHAAVMMKTRSKWYLLDAAEETEICITDEPDRAKDYFCSIDYINYYVLKEDHPKIEERADRIRQWFRALGVEDDTLMKPKTR